MNVKKAIAADKKRLYLIVSVFCTFNLYNSIKSASPVLRKHHEWILKGKTFLITRLHKGMEALTQSLVYLLYEAASDRIPEITCLLKIRESSVLAS